MKLSEIGSFQQEGIILQVLDFIAKAPDDECYGATEIGDKLKVERTTINRIAWKIPLANKIKLKHNRHIQWFFGSKKAIEALRKRVDNPFREDK